MGEKMFPDGFLLRPFVEFFAILLFFIFMITYSSLTAGFATLFILVWLYNFSKEYEEISSNIRKLK
jgi:hypothetical protein